MATRTEATGFFNDLRSQLREEMYDTARELGVQPPDPDRQRRQDRVLEGMKPAGNGARTRPAWEADYERQAQLWGEEERKVRTPEGDVQICSWFRAYVQGDHQAMREADPQWARALTTGAGGDGLVTPGAFSEVIFAKERDTDRMRNFMTVIPTNDTTVSIPWEKVVPIPAVFAEGADMSAGVTSPDFESKTATPKKIGMVFSFTRELFDDSPIATVNLLSSRVAHAIGEAEDAQIINNTTSALTNSLEGEGTASSDTWDDDAETLASLSSKIMEMPRDQIPFCRWLINTDAAKDLMSKGPAAGERPAMLPFNEAPTLLGDFGGGGARSFGSLVGLPVHVFSTAVVPANTAILGNLRSCALVDRQRLYVDTNRGVGFNTDTIALHVSRRVDMVIQQTTHVRIFPAA